jgi:hypothetical protein
LKTIMPIVAMLLCSMATPAIAWWGNGHYLLSQAAVQALPDEVPAFFRASGDVVAAASIDPDLHKNRAVPNINKTEYTEHFIDLELLEGAPLPALRYDFIALCYEKGVDPTRVGFGPYALAEWTGRLAVAFAEYRKWPEDEGIQSKCLVYAGFIAHYAQDLMQPLHTTVHYNGIKQEDGTIIQKGIHEKVDSAIERLKMVPADLASGQELAVHDSLMAGIIGALESSHARVSAIYDVGAGWDDIDNEQMQALSQERARASVQFNASLYLTAWRKSDGMWLPGWLDREMGAVKGE